MCKLLDKLKRDTRYLQVISDAPKEDCMVAAMEHTGPSAYSQREISELLDISPTRVSQILGRAKKKVGKEAFAILQAVSDINEDMGVPYYSSQQRSYG